MSASNGGGAATAASRRRASANGNGAAAKSRAKAEAAVAEVEDKAEQKTVEFCGLTLELPTALPKTLLWDIAAAQDNIVAYFQLAQSLLKDEQLPAVREALIDSDLSSDDFTVELLETILDAYGLGMGESAAS